jgi:hypothetical protein
MADTRAKGGAGRPGKGRPGNGRPGKGRVGIGGPDNGVAQEWDLAGTVGVAGTGGAPGTGGVNGASLSAGPTLGHRHDPRIDEPTKQDRRRLWKWVALMAFCPICLGVVVWAAIGLNGSYPTVQPPVPAGWQSVAGIYASFSVPGSWSLKQFMSDAAGDIYYSGPGGGVGESVAQADHEPNAAGPLPVIVGTFLGWKYQVSSIATARIPNATVAWRYRFHLANGTSAMGVLAWVKPTQSEVWLVASRDSPTTEKAISTLTLAS